jgi:molybdopterin-guanine dinucleotide biosynthesis protein A
MLFPVLASVDRETVQELSRGFAVVITAGGRVSGSFAKIIGTDIKALAPLGSRRLIDPVIDAAKSLNPSSIAIIGPPEITVYSGRRVDRVISSSPSGVDNIKLALKTFPEAERLVFLTSDMPFIDEESLRSFVVASQGYALTMALASAESYQSLFPDAPPHAVRLDSYSYANGSAFVVDRQAIGALEGIVGRFFGARKSLTQLAALLGLERCLRFAFGRLNLSQIEKHASKTLGVSTRAIVDGSPKLCFDVDDIDDWNYAQKFLISRG